MYIISLYCLLISVIAKSCCSQELKIISKLKTGWWKFKKFLINIGYTLSYMSKFDISDMYNLFLLTICSGSSKLEDAVELYVRAGNAFKMDKCWTGVYQNFQLHCILIYCCNCIMQRIRGNFVLCYKDYCML